MRALVTTCVTLAACFSPTPSPGGPCSRGPGPACPDGLVCAAATDTCERDSAAPPDGSTDTVPPDVSNQYCFGTGAVTGCLPAPPIFSLSIPINATSTLDTTDDASCTAIIDGNCVIAATGIDIGGTLRAVGARPIVLVSDTTISIGGKLDVATRAAESTVGAGANAAACNPGTTPLVHTGGGGGSFGGKGGSGHGGVPLEGGGVAAGTIVATLLHGGCTGATGAGNVGGVGGGGGGAVYVIARSEIDVTGTINASGAGGKSCPLDCGGGGGGSGGMIGLDGTTIAVSGQVFANGGGGAEGCHVNPGGAAGGEAVDATTPAPGGDAGLNGGNGGPGSAGPTIIGGDGLAPTAGNPAGGGGGGGGAGVIKLHGASVVNGVLSPAAS